MTSRLLCVALAVVFGDIGTSPFYTLSSVFTDLYGNATVPNPDDIRGALCNIVWLLTSVVSIKYVALLMTTGSFHGEGGTFSLLQNLRASGKLASRPVMWRFFQMIAVAAAALIVADGVLTPVVTITSAVEGIGLSVWRFNGASGTVSLDNQLPGTASNYGRTCTLSAGIIVLVFCLQAMGSQRIGTLYGPIVIVWFLFIGITGIQRIAEGGGSIFAAWNPYWLRYFWTKSSFKGTAAWHSLGGIFLAVTGAEALFADLGHFGIKAIAIAWFGIAYPMLLFAYSGQAAFLLSLGDLTDGNNPSLCFSFDPVAQAATPGAGIAPFATYLSFPSPQASCAAEGFVGVQTGTGGPNGVVSNVFWWTAGKSFGSSTYKAILAVATLVSVVASQALITGVFTILTQAASLGLFPYMRVKHTSTLYEHQIFVGGANVMLCIMCLIVTGTFQHSSNLTAVYGACVSMAMVVTTVLYCGVVYFSLGAPLLLAIAICLPLLFMDGALASANVAKFFVSGPVQLSYPSNTAAELQHQSSVGAFGPVPQNAWVAMIPLIVASIFFIAMVCWTWGRRKSCLNTARQSAFLLRRVDTSQPLSEEVKAIMPLLAARTRGSGGGTEGVENEYTLDSGYTIDTGALATELHDVAHAGTLAHRYSALEESLVALAEREDGLLRSNVTGIFLASGTSFWDTEAAATDPGEALQLPASFLRTVISTRSLPALTILLDVRFEAGLAYSTRRTEVRPVGNLGSSSEAESGGVGSNMSPIGIYHIILRYGFAEQPAGEAAICGLLEELAESPAHPALAPLKHTRCSMGHCACRGVSPASNSSQQQAGVGDVGDDESGMLDDDEALRRAGCQPVTFYTSADSLHRPTLLEAGPAAVYNAMLHLTNGKAAFLDLPPTHVMSLAGGVDLGKLRPHRRRRTRAVVDLPHDDARA